jgi:Outer membrane protein beta-barrel domain
MARHLFPKLTLAILFVTASIPAFSQVAPAATEGGLPLVVGVGISDYDLDWGYGRRMVGISPYIDWNLDHLPGLLRNVSIEGEAHFIDFARPTSIQPRMQQDTVEGGLMYTWRHYRNLAPYVKAMGGVGTIHFPSDSIFYTRDRFNVIAPGGGLEYHIWRQFWVRGDYEYQFWQHTFGPHDLTPQGFTIGASYHFRHAYPRSN